MDRPADCLIKIPVRTIEDRQHVAAWIFTPDAVTPRSVIVCVPGGTFSKLYYHPDAGGATGYSMAEFLRARGHLVVVLDNLGVGDSSRPANGDGLDKMVMADANAQAIAFVMERVKAGDLSSGLPAIDDLKVIGVGHSMGGFSSVVLQANHGSFDALAVLGWTNQRGANTGHQRAIDPNYTAISRDDVRSFFHLPDVPAAVIAADDRHAEPVPSAMLVDAGREGASSAEAARIHVPVFMCFGEVDLCPTPHLEPATYPKSRDLTLMVLTGSAHNHNFSSNRLRLFRRLAAWIEGLEP